MSLRIKININFMKNIFKILSPQRNNKIILFLGFLIFSIFTHLRTQAFYDSVNHVYERSIIYAQNQGIIEGYQDGTFRPNNIINRAEFTKIIIEARFSQSEILSCDMSTISFPDVNIYDWFSPYICTALNHKIIKGYPDGFFRPRFQRFFLSFNLVFIPPQHS